MESLWQKAKTFAEEAASQTLTLTTSPAKIAADIVSETAKRSKDLALEASRKADQHINSLAHQIQIPSLSLSPANANANASVSDSELESLGITEELKQLVKGFSALTFHSFPIQDDDMEGSDVATVSNVRQDLSEWQQRHATLVLTTIKGISRLRYELCPRHMKDQRFWRIYFTLVNSHVAPYEKNYMDKMKMKEAENIKDGKIEGIPKVGSDRKEASLKSQTSCLSTEQDLDSFLLGDLENSDVEAGKIDDDDADFDDDFDKIDNLDAEETQVI